MLCCNLKMYLDRLGDGTVVFERFRVLGAFSVQMTIGAEINSEVKYMGEAKDLIGLRFNRLAVVRKTDQRLCRSIVWECRCDCGNSTFASSSALLSGKRKSCGCLRNESGKKKAQDITGMRFGRLTALRPTEKRQSESVVWECQCDCGEIDYAPVILLRAGKKKSCGCLRSDVYEGNKRDVTGLRFGKLTAICPTDKREADGSVVWKWRCDCSEVIDKSLNSVSRGLIRSCGCLLQDVRKDIYSEYLKPAYVLGTNLNMLRQNEDVLRADNVSGVKGVHFRSSENVYIASIKFKGVIVQKRYKRFEDAVDARRRMKAIHSEFLEWWDSLSDEARSVVCAEFEQERNVPAVLIKEQILRLV